MEDLRFYKKKIYNLDKDRVDHDLFFFGYMQMRANARFNIEDVLFLSDRVAVYQANE